MSSLILLFLAGVISVSAQVTSIVDSILNSGNDNQIVEYADSLYDLYKRNKEPHHIDSVKKLYEYAANAGDPYSMGIIGQLYFNGEGYDINFSKTVEWWEKALALEFDADIAYNLALMYQTGRGVPINMRKAISLYESAATQGSSRAMYNLGCIYQEGLSNIETDKLKAYAYFSDAAQKNHLLAMNRLGLMYEEGDGIDRNIEKAFYWLEKSASQGTHEALFNLGNMYYYTTEGVLTDYARAKWFYEKAIEMGSDLGYLPLGQIYMKGQGVSVDYEMAIKCYENALKSSEPIQVSTARVLLPFAKAKLGEKYYNEKNYKKAFPVIESAANDSCNPSSRAMRLLAAFYRYGLGNVTVDAEKEKYWLEKASKVNDRVAVDMLK